VLSVHQPILANRQELHEPRVSITFEALREV
jgi:hypothetical protein